MFVSVENLGQFSPTQTVPASSCPEGVFRNFPTAPTYSAQYSLQLTAPHSSGIKPGEKCPPEMDGGTLRRSDTGNVFYARTGNTYILTGTRGWLPCPKWPLPPSTLGSLPELIHRIRIWIDDMIRMNIWTKNVYGPYEGMKPTFCPGHHSPAQRSALIRAIDEKMGQVSSFYPFREYVWNLIFPEGGLGFFYSGWEVVGGEYVSPARPDIHKIEEHAKRLRQVMEAWDAPPWPHEWFKTFVTSPLVAVPPIHDGYKWNDGFLSDSSYFPRPTERIKQDLADYIAANENLLNDHFNAEVLAWAKREEEKAKKKQALFQFLGIVAFILDFFTFGAASAAMSMVNIYRTKQMTDKQVSMTRQIQDHFGITDEAIEKFRVWVVGLAKAPKVQIPTLGPRDPAVSGKYGIYIEQKPAIFADTPEDVLRKAYSNTQTGERILVKDEMTGQVVNYFLREQAALKKVPLDQAAKLQALGPDAAGRIAGKPEFPTWALLIPVALKVL
jgi:hypothetical protein